ncbi:MAG: amino acid permease, partial [Gemmatimonadota bacterium]
PGRTVPRALAIGVTVVTVAYILTSAAFLYLVPLERVSSGATFAAQAGEALFGPAGGVVFATIVIVSVLGSLAVVLMVLPRVYYAMAHDGLFFRSVGVAHPRFGTPARAIAIQAALASLLVVIGSFDAILAYFIFVTVAFIALTGAGVFVLRRRDARTGGARVPGGPAEALPTPGFRTFRAPGYPVTPAVFLGLAALLLFLLAMRSPLQAVLGVAVVGLGAPAYLLFRGRGGGAAGP